MIHTDLDAAASSGFGSLIASGWHVAILVIKQMVETKPFGSTSVKRSKPDRGTVKTKVETLNQEGTKS